MIHFILTFLCVFLCAYLATGVSICYVFSTDEIRQSRAKVLKLCLTWPAVYVAIYKDLKKKSNENEQI